jgi:uncharacterized protein (DUF433 family)
MPLQEDQLINTYIEVNPHKPWLAEARLKDYGVPVWAIVGHLPAVEDDVEQVAADYEIPIEAVNAALAFYHRHQALIDARLAANSTNEISADVVSHAI